MNYFSIEFSLIFLIFLAIYWNLKNLIVQNTLLLLFNYIIIFLFGGINVAITLLCYSIFIHFCALFINHFKTKFFLLMCISFSVLILCFFKYYPDLKDFLEGILSFIGIHLSHQTNIILPLGISFYTFASITYLKSVYDNKTKGFNIYLESFENLATYLSFFPTFVSGPIMRSEFFFTQLRAKRIWNNSYANLIFILLLFGIVKKILIASHIENYTSPILQSPQDFSTIKLLLAIYGYSLQIYCDFSGYINLVSAFALMIGFTLPPNFNMPYIARNLKDFWNRWHISLSTFIRDFIYIPLGGNKKGFFATQIFVLIAFGISGIWHGNTINFLIWGLLHGFGIVMLNTLKHYNIHLKNIPLLPKILTFNYVTFCWIFFYYPDFTSALSFLESFKNIALTESLEIYLLLFGFCLFIIYQFMDNFLNHCVKLLEKIPNILKPVFIACILFIIFKYMPNGIPNFIYASF